MHAYSRDFYGQSLRLLVLGYIRCGSGQQASRRSMVGPAPEPP
jgi:hypothetical protein